MQFSKNWIGDYVDLPESAEELARRLTGAGHAVDTIEVVETALGTDHLLEVEVTTNRPDCMCHLGLAREVATLFGRELKVPNGDALQPVADRVDAVATLSVDDSTLCPSFTLQGIRGVKVGPSPPWLVARLEAIGSRSINNVVDITNYVLWETGQPLHAYDLRKLATGDDGRHVVRVRRANDGEVLKTLDGEERKLDPAILVIADADEAIGLGGIMGGFDSEVTDETVDVLLEAGHFDPSTVRHGAKNLALKTDAGHRFERGADPKACYWAARRAAALIVELAGGELLDGHLEVTALRQDWPPVVDISLAKLERFGGITLGAERVESILGALGFTLESRADGDDTRFRVTPPSWRWYDFEGAHAQDVYEEVLRIHGFDPIEPTLPTARGADAPMRPEHKRRRAVQDTLAACGFAEAITFAFHDRESDAAYPSFFAEREAMALANPLSDLYAVMRRSLLPNLGGRRALQPAPRRRRRAPVRDRPRLRRGARARRRPGRDGRAGDRLRRSARHAVGAPDRARLLRPEGHHRGARAGPRPPPRVPRRRAADAGPRRHRRDPAARDRRGRRRDRSARRPRSRLSSLRRRAVPRSPR